MAIETKDKLVTLEDLKASHNYLKSEIGKKADVIVSSVSGDIVTFTDGGNNLPVKDLTVAIEPVQSGTGDPSPTNVRPISGWTGANIKRCGVNLWDGVYYAGYAINASTGKGVATSGEACSSSYVRVIPNTDYFFNVESIGSSTRGMAWFDDKQTYISGVTFPNDGDDNPRIIGVLRSPANASYIRFSLKESKKTITSINHPASDTDYHTYQGITLPISWQSSAGTVYGGMLDVTTGVLTVDEGYISLTGNEDWNTSGGYFYTKIGDLYTVPDDVAICSHLIEAPNISSSNSVVGFRVYNRFTSSFGAAVLIRFDSTKQQTLEQFTTYLASQVTAGTPVQVAYKLNQTTTYQLDPVTLSTLLGENNIWADTGAILNCDYRVDTDTMIQDIEDDIAELDSKINSVDESLTDTQGMIATVEATSTASKNYAVGEFLVYNDTLYKVVSIISSGGTITPGTNCIADTIENELNQKQDALTFDTTPTANSINPVTSGGIKMELDTVDAKKADVIVSSASGEIASFEDGADGLPVKDLTVTIEPVQSGTGDPFPEMSFAIPALEQGSLDSSGTVESNTRVRTSDFIDLPIGSYTLTYDSDKQCIAFVYDLQGEYVSSNLFWNGWKSSPQTFSTTEHYKLKLVFIFSGNATIVPSDVSSVSLVGSNICPISGWTGANISRTRKNLYSGDSYKVFSAAGAVRLNFDNILPIEQYVLSFDVNAAAGFSVHFQYDNKNVSSEITKFSSGAERLVFPLTTTNNSNKLYIYANTAVTITNIQIEIGSTATEYEPYLGTTIPISWQSSAGTVYGGTLDVMSGVLTDKYDWAIAQSDGSFKNANGDTITVGGNNTDKYVYLNISDQEGEIIVNSQLCNMYKNGPVNTDVACCLYWSGSNKKYRLTFKDSNIPGWQSAVGHAGLRTVFTDYVATQYSLGNILFAVWEKTTGTEYDLDSVTISTLLGQNNIWADTGDILNVEYRADTGLYIAGKQVDIRSSIAPIEDDTTASQAYAQGKYFFHNGDFCKAKTAIASGAAFTLNTNYEVTTVADELFTALNS